MKYVPFLISLVFVTSCQVGPSYHPPCVQAPEEWKADAKPILPPPPIENWWEVFGDPTLCHLEEKALYNSPNLYVALERVVESRAVAGFVKADLYPQVTFEPGYSNTGFLFKLLGLNAVPFPKTTKINPIVRVHQLEYSLPFNLSYELDLWGRIRSQVRSAVLASIAQEEDFRNTLLTLTTEVATHYFLMRSLDAEIDFLEKTVEVLRHSYDINSARFNKGLVTLIDETEALQTLATTEATLHDVHRQRTIEENAIAALLGIPASCFTLDSMPLLMPPPEIPAGVPCSVLLNRPDLAALERKMASDHALIQSAYASFFPSLTLTGSIGMLSPDFKDFVTWQSRLWSMGANVFETIFDGGRKDSNLNIAYARFNQASGSYQQAVINAFQEVEDALTDIEWQARQSASLKEAVDASEQTVRLSTNRYQKGLVNYLEVDTSLRNSLNVEISYINTVGQSYLSTIRLIKAIGGSWE